MNGFTLIDGAMGTMLQSMGLEAGENTAMWGITHPDRLQAVHEAYISAGTEMVITNTFGANEVKLGNAGDPDAAVRGAVRAAKASGAKTVALDIGPTGELFEPMGELTFERAYEVFCREIRVGAEAGADAVIIETMSDLLEARAAVLAAKDCCDLPIYVTMTFGSNGRTLLGNTPEIAGAVLSALGVAGVGMNCSVGPEEMLPLVKRMLEYSTAPLVIQPNAGLPRVVNGETVYDVTPEQFADNMEKILDAGAMLVGGCCGTSPAYIAALADKIKKRTFTAPETQRRAVLCGLRALVQPGEEGTVTALRLALDDALAAAIAEGDRDYISEEAMAAEEDGAGALYLHALHPALDERTALPELVRAVQAASPMPLIIAGRDAGAVEKAVRVCGGKPMTAPAEGADEAEIMKIAARYGTAVLCRAADEQAAGSAAERAAGFGIAPADVYMDCTGAADPASLAAFVRSLGCLVCIGDDAEEAVADVIIRN